jgi:DNA-binding transcriptional regulator YiaG
MELETFPYGQDGVGLSVTVPVMTCGSCGFSYSDARAEKLRHAAVCAHEGLLNPAEIKSIRDGLGMSRELFSEAFGIPRASMERWENGKLIQNTSLDTLLRALADKSTATRLDRRSITSARSVGHEARAVRFRTLGSDPQKFSAIQHRADLFKLRA